MTATTNARRGPPADGAVRPPRVTKRRAQTRANLVDAAFRVFAAKGFGAVRIDDVCTAAGYTRGAFYSQFDSLDELFFTLYDERASLIAEQVAQVILAETTETTEAGDVRAAIERLSETVLLDRDWLLVKTDFLLHAARHPDVAQRLEAHRGELRSAVERRLRGVSDQLVLPDSIGDIPGAARAVVAAYDGVTVQLLLDADVAAARDWLTHLLTALLVR